MCDGTSRRDRRWVNVADRDDFIAAEDARLGEFRVACIHIVFYGRRTFDGNPGGCGCSRW
jgi:hypothetical protein